MSFWYVADVIRVSPPAAGSALLGSQTTEFRCPMLLVDASETWKITHNRTGATRNVTRNGHRAAFLEEAGYAYEEDNEEPEVCLVRTEVPIPQAVLDECNSVAGGGTWVQAIDTVGKRNALYNAYPSLQNRWPDQP